jgi:hypothetical protein
MVLEMKCRMKFPFDTRKLVMIGGGESRKQAVICIANRKNAFVPQD